MASAETTPIGLNEPPASGEPVVTRRTWIATVTLLVATFMELMDVTMANVAVPSIRSDIDASYEQVQWVVAGYALAFAVMLLTGGRLGDIYGRKRMFLTGLVGFLVTSTLCGVAPTAGFLVASRVLQGLAAAVMLPQVLASISVWFPKEQRAAAFGLFGAVTGLGGLTAPLIAGSLIDADLFGLDWRPIFLINIPIGIAVFLVASSVMGESRSSDRLKVDLLGTLTSAVAVFLIVFPVIQGQEEDWAPWIWVMLALSVPAAALFLLVERRKTRLGESTLVDLRLFRIRSFSVGLLVTLIFFGGVTAIAFVLMVFLQGGLGFGPFKAGVTLIPLALGLMIGAGLSVKLSKALGRTVLQLGGVIAMAGAIWVGWTIIDRGNELDLWTIVGPLAGLGVGLGIVVAPLQDFILSGIPESDAGSASGLQATMVQMGSAIGVATLGVALAEFQKGTSFPTSAGRVLYIDAAVFAFTALLVFLYPRRTTGVPKA
ncbi:MFS transporter [Paractinoplanes ferrugineus]|uniref:MFS transporter n=1 Tax=Paractinoplanes ferrugineus TaxID=113564 RepID=UPI001940EE07|nr:MFS transporter [Actinoplanes ferrugineus]